MHPEIEEHLRESARKYLATNLEIGPKEDIHLRAAEAGVISLDDIYFLCVVTAASSLSLQDLMDDENVRPLEKEATASTCGINIFNQDGRQQKQDVWSRAKSLTGLLYRITPSQVESRYDQIEYKVKSYHNSKLGK